MVAFPPGHPKWDQNPWFTPLNETTSIPDHFAWEAPRALNTTSTLSPNRHEKNCSMVIRFITNLFHEVYLIVNSSQWEDVKLSAIMKIRTWFASDCQPTYSEHCGRLTEDFRISPSFAEDWPQLIRTLPFFTEAFCAFVRKVGLDHKLINWSDLIQISKKHCVFIQEIIYVEESLSTFVTSYAIPWYNYQPFLSLSLSNLKSKLDYLFCFNFAPLRVKVLEIGRLFFLTAWSCAIPSPCWLSKK